MSDEIKFPSGEELAELPTFSIAVYAVRCALRVQPLWISGMNPKTEYKKAIIKLNSAYKILTSNIATAGSARITFVTATTTINSLFTKIDFKALKDSLRVAADAAAIAADARSPTAIATDAVAIATDAVAIADTGVGTFEKAAKTDYAQLKAIKTEVTDASETGPLGDLWHGSPPDWYIKSKAHYDKTITEWERELVEGEGIEEINTGSFSDQSFSTASFSDQAFEITAPPLSVYVDPGSSSPELITELYIALDALYRANGGSGLEIVKEERRSMAGETV